MRAGAQLRILVIEDEAMMGRTIGRALAMRGYSVVTTPSCAEARAAEGRFDIGVFDIDLPDGNGVRLAESLLRAGVVYAAVFFSGTCSGESIKNASKLGAFVHKSDGVTHLIDAIEKQVAQSLRAMAVGAEAELDDTGGRPASGFRSIVPK